MEKNIFEGAYFGKPYRTRDGRKAIYWRHVVEHHLLIETGYMLCKDDGLSFNINKPNLDIISEWEEEINEEELDKLAVEYADNAEMTGTLPDGYNTGCWDYLDIVKAFKAGRLSKH